MTVAELINEFQKLKPDMKVTTFADELYKFSDELDMCNSEECKCKISIIEAIKELNNITEYITKRTLGDTHESSK